MSDLFKPFGRLIYVGDDEYITEFYSTKVEIDGIDVLFTFSIWNRHKDEILKILNTDSSQVIEHGIFYHVRVTLKHLPALNIFQPSYPSMIKIDGLYDSDDAQSYVITCTDLTIYSVVEREEDGWNDYLHLIRHTDKYNDFSDILPQDFRHKEIEVIMRLLYICLTSRVIEKDCALVIKDYLADDYDCYRLMDLMNICTYFSDRT